MITPQIAAEILALAALVVPITQAVKKWLKVEGWNAIIVSAVLTVLLSLWRTLAVPPYDWSKFIILVIGVFLESNGIYHFGAYAMGKMVKKEG
ncbi:MAG: hypothetical protein AMS17_15025 [Spirochaetes bacterium DG_61]|jgi:hypothetical protein|nr:MAG: hypothetical protein AMS17_15025 [Spirochaetes bacterium DG_61]